MPNKARLLKWVEALESGKYHQTSRSLRSHDGNRNTYCCLGVACDVYRKETGKGKWRTNNAFMASTIDQQTLILPRTVARWFGVESNPRLVEDWPSAATYWNDSANYSFKKIAELIRKTYLLGPRSDK